MGCSRLVCINWISYSPTFLFIRSPTSPLFSCVPRVLIVLCICIGSWFEPGGIQGLLYSAP